jgi:hypothetical protein
MEGAVARTERAHTTKTRQAKVDRDKDPPIESGGPPAQLVQHDEGVRGCVPQDRRRLVALHQEGALASNYPVLGTCHASKH